MEADTIPITLGLSQLFTQANLELLISSLVLLFFLAVSALISGSEVAFFSISPADKDELKKAKKKNGKVVLDLLNIPEKLLATILVGNNFVNIAIVLLSSFVADQLFDFSFMTPFVGFFVQTIGITFLLLLFGEIIPKVYASQFSKNFALRMAPLLNLLEKLFRPLNAILIFFTSVVNNRFHKHQSSNISVSDLSQALELTSDDEIIRDKDILEGIVTFGSKSVVEIMRSRIDVIAIDFSTPFPKVIETITESGYSRIPVYQDTLDNVKGILYSKDLLPYIQKGETFRWQTLIREPYFVPESKKIDDLLEDFQKSKVHLATVVDEYGGTHGIVTLEDILEEIVGDISDELDEDESYFTRISPKEYIFDGKTLINDFYRVIDCKEDIFEEFRGEAETLAGLLLEVKGEFPRASEEIVCKGFRFFVRSFDNRRIKDLRVILPDSLVH